MTRIFGVIGHPIGHSLSPVMHAAAFRALRLDALYEPFEVAPRFLAPILRGLTLAGVDGLNVTVPLKEAVLPLLDRVDPDARAIGAVNTIRIKNRRLTGYNTDTIGLRMALNELGWPACRSDTGAGRRPRPACVVVLGAGGAARAVVWELSRIRGSCLTIANRHLPRAQRLAHWLARLRPQVCVEAVPLNRVDLDGADLVVNATTVGMRASDGSPVDPRQLRRGMFVYDLVYHRDTALVRAARRRGCVAANGLSMLLYQGAASLRLWLHRTPPIAVMRKALERAATSDMRQATRP